MHAKKNKRNTNRWEKICDRDTDIVVGEQFYRIGASSYFQVVPEGNPMFASAKNEPPMCLLRAKKLCSKDTDLSFHGVKCQYWSRLLINLRNID
jgi:hypothetical protein